MAQVEAFVTPGVLVWARKQAGYTLEQVAARLKREANEIRAWESGTARPSMAKARQLAHHYKRSLGDFYLDAPPHDPTPPTDYRSGPWITDEQLRAAIAYEVRRLVALREAAVDLAEINEAPLQSIAVRASLNESEKTVAERLRSALGISVDEQRQWQTAEQAWNAWRSAVESLGVLVFIIREVNPLALSGLSLSSEIAPVIAIAGTDHHPHRKLFTLIHELVHVALRKDGVCDLMDEDPPGSSAHIEVFCNAVAADVLMPAGMVLSHPLVEQHGKATWADGDLSELSTAFRVSRQAIYRRLVALERADFNAYRHWAANHPYTPPQHLGSGGSFYNQYFHDFGMPYLGLVFDAYHAKRINLANLCDYLGHKVETVKGIEQRYIERVIAKGER